MLWTRMEDGQIIQVTLARIDDLPETYGVRLLGL
jgi:hypothetical protein